MPQKLQFIWVVTAKTATPCPPKGETPGGRGLSGCGGFPAYGLTGQYFTQRRKEGRRGGYNGYSHSTFNTQHRFPAVQFWQVKERFTLFMFPSSTALLTLFFHPSCVQLSTCLIVRMNKQSSSLVPLPSLRLRVKQRKLTDNKTSTA